MQASPGTFPAGKGLDTHELEGSICKAEFSRVTTCQVMGGVPTPTPA